MRLFQVLGWMRNLGEDTTGGGSHGGEPFPRGLWIGVTLIQSVSKLGKWMCFGWRCHLFLLFYSIITKMPPDGKEAFDV